MKLRSNTEPEGNMDIVLLVVMCKKMLISTIADIDDSQTCVSSVSQSTGTMTELTSEFVEDLMRDCNALCVENLELKKKLRDVMIPECFVDDAKVSFFTGLYHVVKSWMQFLNLLPHTYLTPVLCYCHFTSL